jgi:hypothetical protein
VTPRVIYVNYRYQHQISSEFVVCFLLGNSLASEFYMYLSAYEDGTQCPITSAYKIQTSGNYQEESIQHSEHGKSFEIKNSSELITKSKFHFPPLKSLVPTQLVFTVVLLYYCRQKDEGAKSGNFLRK